MDEQSENRSRKDEKHEVPLGSRPVGCTAEEEQQEARHFQEVVLAFQEYHLDMMGEISRRERHLSLLNNEQIRRLPCDNLQAKIEEMKQCVKRNQDFFDKVVNDHSQPLSRNGDLMVSAPHNSAKVRSCLHQCAREWSKEGKAERDACFNPILSELNRVVKKNRRVLCPGAGLGRLPVEIVRAGYSCQGNEFSYHMLLISDYILNQIGQAESVHLYPWVDNTCNVRHSEDLTRSVPIPDETASTLIQGNSAPNLSMCAGEFVEVYAPEGEAWDCVVTCFFLDTAPNIFDYIKTIHAILKQGGIWINHGPLLWHWCSPEFTSATRDSEALDKRYDESLEFSYDEVKHIAESYGFEFIHESWHTCKYSANSKSMLASLYETVLFTCRKPIVNET